MRSAENGGGVILKLQHCSEDPRRASEPEDHGPHGVHEEGVLLPEGHDIAVGRSSVKTRPRTPSPHAAVGLSFSSQ